MSIFPPTIDMLSKTNTCIHKTKSLLFHYIQSWSNHIKSWTCKQNPIPTGVVRYEDLLADPESKFKDILAILGLSDYVQEDAYQFALEQTKFENLKRIEELGGFRETGGKQDKFFHRGIAGGWKDVLTIEQVARIESDHADVMREFGYL